MALRYGVHTGLQNTTIDELRALWTRIEMLGFDWISIWDHFYSADFTGSQCLEAVAAHAALACDTTRVRCGSLVYCAGYRHPAVLANAITTIDHLSGGRADIGLGAGWAFNEYEAYGIPFPSNRERLDILEESVQCVRLLLREEVADFKGEHFTLTERAVRPEAGAGRAADLDRRWWREAHAAHRRASTPTRGTFRSSRPTTSRDKRGVLAAHCDAVGRDPSTITCAVNVGLAYTDESLRQQFGGLAEGIRPGVLTGSDEQIARPIGRYADAGADQINIAMRAPWMTDELERLAPLILSR